MGKASKGHMKPGQQALKHAHSRYGQITPTYRAWSDMKRRCINSKHPAYKWYGARGINFCERWASFKNFLADMGVKPDGTSLDRIDNSSHYKPGNCRWASPQQQAGNKRTNVLLSFNGETKPLEVWARDVGIVRTTISSRLERGWTVERALTTRPR